MVTLNARLLTLELRSKAHHYPAGLGWHWAIMEALDAVGGGDALIERLDAGTATPADRDAMAAIPGGEKRVRALVASLARFYQ